MDRRIARMQSYPDMAMNTKKRAKTASIVPIQLLPNGWDRS